MATGTALSRVTGLARVAAFGYVIGQTALADAYRIGNETPNIVYEVLLGGVVSATFVPLFTGFKERDDEESTNVVVTLAMVGLLFITIIAFFAAPLIFRLYTLDPAEGVDVDQFRAVGTTLTRIFLVQIFFYGATGVANALLQSRQTVLRCGVEPHRLQRRDHRHAAVDPAGRGAGLRPGGRADRRPAALDARVGRNARHRRHGRGPGAGDQAGRHPPAAEVQPAPPGRPPGADHVGVDGRLRRRQPGRP